MRSKAARSPSHTTSPSKMSLKFDTPIRRDSRKRHNAGVRRLRLGLANEAVYDVVIVGSGPAGLTSAIYTSRANFKTLVIGGALWGGQLVLTSEVENFPGFPEGVLGPDLMDDMRRQAERFGAELIFEDATSVNLSSRPFKVSVRNQTYQAKAIIVATGASPRWLGLESEARLIGKGVASCATCDAAFFQGKKVVVVGGGDTALDEALTLAKFASEVKVVHRRSQLRATRIIQERAFKNEKISFILDTEVKDILGQERVERVRLKNVRTSEESELQTDGVFIAIGQEPNTELFEGKIELDEKGYVLVRDGSKTSVEGVFAAGDVQDLRYRQAITAAGEGCKAALDASRYLEEHP